MKRLPRRSPVPVAAVCLLLALLPTALYLGHWPFLPGFHASANAEEAHEHAGHCHAGPSKCSDAPATPQPMLLSGGVLAPACLGLMMLLAGALRSTVRDPLARRPARPPRRTPPLFAS